MIATYVVNGARRKVQVGSWLRAEELAAETNWTLVSVMKVGVAATTPVSKLNQISK